MWTYKGVDIYRAERNGAGIHWYARTAEPGRQPWQQGTPAMLRADTKQGMRELINRYQEPLPEITRTIWQGGDGPWTLFANGNIQRHDVPPPYNTPSGQWAVTGAVTLNNFGNAVHRYSLAEIIADPGAIPWKHKNGKQKTHITDLDHGTHRMWMSPGHYVH